MHIGIDVSRLAVAQRTGTEHYTWELLQALGQIDTHNHYTLYANRRPAALPPLPPRFQLRCDALVPSVDPSALINRNGIPRS